MSPCDIPLRVRIFLIFSPSFLLINISTVYEILHFPTILHYNSIWKRRSKTKNFLSIFCRLPTHPPPRKRRKVRKFFGFDTREFASVSEAHWFASPRNRSVRVSFKPPRAPRVRSQGFCSKWVLTFSPPNSELWCLFEWIERQNPFVTASCIITKRMYYSASSMDKDMTPQQLDSLVNYFLSLTKLGEKSEKPTIVAVTGFPGSGKTTVAKHVTELLGGTHIQAN